VRSNSFIKDDPNHPFAHSQYNKRISGRANTLIAKDFLSHLDQEQQLEFCINKEKRSVDSNVQQICTCLCTCKCMSKACVDLL